MRELNAEGQRVVSDLSHRYGVSGDAVTTLLQALIAATAAWPSSAIPELGGMGQWSQGGMIMVGDMFNHGLKARGRGLCSELACLGRPEPGVGTEQPQSQSQGGRRAWVPGAGGGSSGRGGRPSSVSRLDRGPERRALCLVPGHPAARHRVGRPADRLRHRRPPDRRLLPAAGSAVPRSPSPSQHGPIRVADLPVVTAASGATAPPAPPRPRRSRSRQPSPRTAERGAGQQRRVRKDRAARCVARERDHHRRGVRREEGRAAQPALGRAWIVALGEARAHVREQAVDAALVDYVAGLGALGHHHAQPSARISISR